MNLNTIEVVWSCHICREIRPDNLIGVLQKPFVVNGMVIGTQNVRYCLDKPACFECAKNFSFVSTHDSP